MNSVLPMEPLELGIVAAWLWKNGAEKPTSDIINSILPSLKDGVLKLPTTLQKELRNIGDRLQGKLPSGTMNEQKLLAMVAEEIKEPEVVEVMENVWKQIQIPIPSPTVIENWKGINVKGNGNRIYYNTLTIK